MVDKALSYKIQDNININVTHIKNTKFASTKR